MFDPSPDRTHLNGWLRHIGLRDSEGEDKGIIHRALLLSRSESLPEGPDRIFELKLDGDRTRDQNSWQGSTSLRNDNDFPVDKRKILRGQFLALANLRSRFEKGFPAAHYPSSSRAAINAYLTPSLTHFTSAALLR
jgi:hypothetical protein